MGSNLGTLRRNKDEQKVSTDASPVHEAEFDSDLENTGIKTPDEPSPEVSYWGTPEVTAAQLKSQHIMSLIDPRSPNEEISRTPIMIEDEKDNAGKKRINRFLRINQGTNQIDRGAEYTTPTGQTVPAAFDPRSPTSEIVRTPIAAEEKKESCVRTLPTFLKAEGTSE